MMNKNILGYDTQDVLNTITEDYKKGELINMSINRGKIEKHYLDINTGETYIIIEDLN